MDWIQSRAVWWLHVRLDECDVLTPQVRRQCVYRQQMVCQRRRFTTINQLKMCCYRSRLIFNCCFQDTWHCTR